MTPTYEYLDGDGKAHRCVILVREIPTWFIRVRDEQGVERSVHYNQLRVVSEPAAKIEKEKSE